VNKDDVSARHRDAYLAGVWHFARWWEGVSEEAEDIGEFAMVARLCDMLGIKQNKGVSYGEMRRQISTIKRRMQYSGWEDAD